MRLPAKEQGHYLAAGRALWELRANPLTATLVLLQELHINTEGLAAGKSTEQTRPLIVSLPCHYVAFYFVVSD